MKGPKDMSSTVTASSAPASLHRDGEGVPLWRLYVLRAMYMLLVVGLGAMIVPPLVSHELGARGVIPSLLGAVWLLAFLGLKYPLQMLPLLMFELVWKLLWTVSFGLPQWFAGEMPPTFAEDVFNIGLGVVLMPFVIPWGYVYRNYVRAPGARWR